MSITLAPPWSSSSTNCGDRDRIPGESESDRCQMRLSCLAADVANRRHSATRFVRLSCEYGLDRKLDFESQETTERPTSVRRERQERRCGDIAVLVLATEGSV